MLYTQMTKKALKLCFDAHKNQVDKNAMPYVYHPFHLAEQMTTEETVIVALLHDVVEDTEYTLEDIRKIGFSDDIVEALSLMTHDESVPYMDYVAKIRDNKIAKAVKLADLRHNSDLSRLDTVDDKAIKRVRKYAEAISLLTGNESKFENISFKCYNERYISLFGKIIDGCLSLESCVYGEEYDSERHYHFSAEDTEKLFSVMTLNEFINLCRARHLIGLELFLNENKITYTY